MKPKPNKQAALPPSSRIIDHESKPYRDHKLQSWMMDNWETVRGNKVEDVREAASRALRTRYESWMIGDVFYQVDRALRVIEDREGL